MSNLIHFLASALGRFHVVLGMALLRDGVLATAGTPGRSSRLLAWYQSDWGCGVIACYKPSLPKPREANGDKHSCPVHIQSQSTFSATWHFAQSPTLATRCAWTQLRRWAAPTPVRVRWNCCLLAPADARTWTSSACCAKCARTLLPVRSTARLAELEHSNLLLVPLDNTREWYRYHHLFAELLRH